MQKYYTIVTDLGTELLAKAAQKGQKVNIVNIAAGDGNGTLYNPTSDMTTLKREIWRGKIQNYEIDPIAKNVIKISGVIPKDVGNFVLRELGLFDDNNNMIAVCNAPDLLKAVLEEGALTEAVVYMRIAVTNTEVVNIVVNSSAIYATQQELEAHKIDDSAHQELFDKKVNKTEMETQLNQKVDKTDFTTELNKKVDKTKLTTELNKKVDKTDFTTELNKKVDKTDFTGANIGQMLTAEGWQSGTTLNNIVDGEKTGSIKQVNATVTAQNASAFGTGKAQAQCAHAEGDGSIASGYASHAEGCGGGTISGGTVYTTAFGLASHAEGASTQANGSFSHAEGSDTIASEQCSHAEGYGSQAKGAYAHAGGYMTIAQIYQTAIGKRNIDTTGGVNNTHEGTAFIIGNGNSDTARSNAFRVQYDGSTYAKGSYNSSGADYAELFQWFDNNENNEDRAGLFVTLRGNKIEIAKPTDSYILGVISANPSVVGDVQDDQWKNMYLTDIFGRILYEIIEIQGQKRKVPKLNPEYDNTQIYIPRSARPEWDAVGMLGKLAVIDDGSCNANEFCTVGNGGIATKANDDKGYYVMSRLDKNHIQILFR